MIDRQQLSDAAFLSSRIAAYKAELAVAYTCAHLGAVDISVGRYRVRPLFKDRADYRDGGDLLVQWNHNGGTWKYEVKRGRAQFTTASEYPHELVIVDEVANLDGKKARPDGYFICNVKLDGALFISLRENSLDRFRRRDCRYNQPIDYYTVPRDRAKFVPLNWLEL
jgi:hypothetical protein